ncbi:hypothetical protein BGX30_010613 [Mortierella sp. GBA39]|nr:hypothetical protein BGX30_010613 [Mortierella sp. GBA39]
MSVPSTRHGSSTATATTLRCIRFPMRCWILIISGVGLMISYADRSNMAVAIVAIGAEFGYNKTQQGIILASFFFGYIVTPILGGTLSDRYGGKAVLATGALVWTAFTVCTPLAAAMGLNWLVITRIGLGLGEGTVAECQLFLNSSCSKQEGQDQEALHCLLNTANQPDHVSGGQLEDENEQIRTISSNGEPILYRPLSSIPLEQTTSRHSEVLPSAIQGAMGLFAGYLGDKVIQDWNWSPLMVRRVGQSVGSFGLGIFLLLAVKLARTATMAMILVTIGMALNGFTMIGASVYQHDFCPEHAGFIFSLGNTAGSLPAIVGVYFVGFLLDGHGANRWDVIWTSVCALYFVGATAFVLLSTHKRF